MMRNSGKRAVGVYLSLSNLRWLDNEASQRGVSRSKLLDEMLAMAQ